MMGMADESADDWVDEGLKHYGTGQLPQALQAGQGALELEPENAEALHELGSVMALRGKLEEALGHWRKAAEIQPGFALAQLNIGHALVSMRRLEEAGPALQRAAQVSPRDPRPRYLMGDLLQMQQQHEAAIEQYRAALALDSSCVNAYQGMSASLAARGRFQEAVEAATRG